MIETAKVKEVVEEFLGQGSTYLVDVTVTPGKDIVVTVDDDEYVDVEMCERLHRHIESRFDREEEDYSLEVGSAGITAPFVMPRQYRKNIGEEVEVLTADGKKFRGELVSVSDEGFTVSVTRKEKPEGAKRKIEVTEEIPYKYSQVKYVKKSIIFK